MLLLDENLSFRLISSLEDLFPGSKHVRDFDLTSGSDSDVWNCAIKEKLAILTKDYDFFNRSTVKGYPPKVIHLQIANARTKEIFESIAHYRAAIDWFLAEVDQSYMILSKPLD